jgi:diguanylate cyclase (GGDEF)-like protein/PAS domain S-box-containing protein
MKYNGDILSLSNDLLKLFPQAITRKKYIHLVVGLIKKWSTCQCVGVRLQDEGGNIPYEDYTGFSEEFWQSENWLSTKRHNCACIRVIKGVPEPQDHAFMTQNGSFHSNNLANDLSKLTRQQLSCFRGTCAKFGYKTLAVIPIHYRDKIIGAVHLADDSADKLSPESLQYLESISFLIGEAVHRFNLEEELQQNYNNQTLINSLMVVSMKEVEIETNSFLQKALNMIVSSDGIDFISSAAIFLFNNDTEVLELKAKVDPSSKINSEFGNLALTKNLRESIKKEKPIFVKENSSDHYILPIISYGKMLGIMILYITEKFYRFKSNEEFLSTIANRLGIIIEHIQVTAELRKKEVNLRSTKQQLADIIEFLPNATFVVDRNKQIIAWNMAIEEMTGAAKEIMIGKGNNEYAVPFYGYPSSMLVDMIFEESADGVMPIYDQLERIGKTITAETSEPYLINGKEMFLSLTAAPFYDVNGNLAGAVQTIHDISKRKRMESQLKYIATHDFLTNIPNRYSLEENLKRAVAKAKISERKSALLYMDIDNFKYVNDTLGHWTGDELIIKLARVLKNNLREVDQIYRFGGDEFAILLEGVTSEEAKRTAERLRLAVNRNEVCITEKQICLDLSISIGIVMIDGSVDPQSILAFADKAVTQAKEDGRNKAIFIPLNGESNNEISETIYLVSSIKKALKENGFELHFQPVVDILQNNTDHYEVLLRLRGEDGNLIYPGQFIPVAERFSLMSSIDQWVVKECISILNQYQSISVFINLSGVSIGDETLIGILKVAIQQNGLDTARIVFEITETVAIRNLVAAEPWIRQIKDLGCKFALDDFGVGFSSFAYLRMLPVDYLKIDGTFVQNLDSNPSHTGLVKAINDVAHTLGKKTIAEFVENNEILEILMSLGVDYGQGYYFGKPSPLSMVYK